MFSIVIASLTRDYFHSIRTVQNHKLTLALKALNG